MTSRRLAVEPRHLAAFVAVADAGSFRAAAEQLGYVQSAVSQHVGQLERALERTLIERGPGGREPTLTSAGRSLLEPARRVVAQVSAARADLECVAQGGPVRVGVEASATRLVAALVASIARVRPDAAVSVTELCPRTQLELIRSDEVELGIGSFAWLGPGVAHRALARDAWVLAVPASGRAELRRSASPLRHLWGKRVFVHRDQPPPVDLRALGVASVVPCDRADTVLALARSGAGCAILPRLTVPRDDDGRPQRAGFTLVPLHDVLPARTVSIAWNPARRLPQRLVEDLLAHGGSAGMDALAAAA